MNPVSLTVAPRIQTDGAAYAVMSLIREFEEAAYRAYEAGDIPGTVHVSIGQEAVAAGVVGALGVTDLVLSHHRGHGHALAAGVDPKRLMAELFGRETGVSGGKGGSMHATDVANGFLGTLAVVASSIPLAVGVGLASKHRADSKVCAVFFGDGGVNQGVLYESMNLASLWGLPVLFICEDNQFAITMGIAESTAGEGVVARARAFGLESASVDGQDFRLVRAATKELLEHVREGRPALLHCSTYRFKGHSRGDPPHGLYRSRDDVALWESRDPLAILAETGAVTGGDVEESALQAKRAISAALEFAASSPHPGVSALAEEIWG